MSVFDADPASVCLPPDASNRRVVEQMCPRNYYRGVLVEVIDTLDVE